MLWRFFNANADDAIAAGLIRLIPWALGWGLCLGIGAILYACGLLH